MRQCSCKKRKHYLASVGSASNSANIMKLAFSLVIVSLVASLLGSPHHQVQLGSEQLKPIQSVSDLIVRPKEQPKEFPHPKQVAAPAAAVMTPSAPAAAVSQPAPVAAAPAPVYSNDHYALMAQAGIAGGDMAAADQIITHESGWRYLAVNSEGSGATGLCQALPGSKMASAGADWASNPITQLIWCNSYAVARYGGWWPAWNHWQITRNW